MRRLIGATQLSQPFRMSTSLLIRPTTTAATTTITSASATTTMPNVLHQRLPSRSTANMASSFGIGGVGGIGVASGISATISHTLVAQTGTTAKDADRLPFRDVTLNEILNAKHVGLFALSHHLSILTFDLILLSPSPPYL
jgi:hypothetical protein